MNPVTPTILRLRRGGAPRRLWGRGHVAGVLLHVLLWRSGEVGVREHALLHHAGVVDHHLLLAAVRELEGLMALVVPHGRHVCGGGGEDASWLYRGGGVGGGDRARGRKGVLGLYRLGRGHQAVGGIWRGHVGIVRHAGWDRLLSGMLHELRFVLLLLRVSQAGSHGLS